MNNLGTSVRVLVSAAAVGLVVGLAPTAGAATVTPPTISNFATTYASGGSIVAVAGKAGPGATVVLHYHRGGTPSSDYSIVRSVTADSSGAWGRAFKMDADYRVFATVGTGNKHSDTVLFTTAKGPMDIGGVQDVKADAVAPTLTLGGKLDDVVSPAIPASGSQPKAGYHFVSVRMSVRDRGPAGYSDDAVNCFALFTSRGDLYLPVDAATANADGSTPGPLDFTDMGVQELRSGELVFEVPDGITVSSLIFQPDSGNSSTFAQWAF